VFVMSLLANLVVFWNQARWSLSKPQSGLYEVRAAELVVRILANAGVIDVRIAGLVEMVLEGGARDRVLLLVWEFIIERIGKDVFEGGVQRIMNEKIGGMKVNEGIFWFVE
jgi:hypothetical protein